MLAHSHGRQLQARRKRLGVERSLLLEEEYNGPPRAHCLRFFAWFLLHVHQTK
jgi:hypothetical protein